MTEETPLPALEIENTIQSAGGSISGTPEALRILRDAIDEAIKSGQGFAAWKRLDDPNRWYQIEIYARNEDSGS